MFFKVYQRVVAVVIDLTAPGKSFFFLFNPLNCWQTLATV